MHKTTTKIGSTTFIWYNAGFVMHFIVSSKDWLFLLKCDDRDLVKFSPPARQTYGWLFNAGATEDLDNHNATAMCCKLSWSAPDNWRNLGVIAGIAGFNILVFLCLYYLYSSSVIPSFLWLRESEQASAQQHALVHIAHYIVISNKATYFHYPIHDMLDTYRKHVSSKEP